MSKRPADSLPSRARAKPGPKPVPDAAVLAVLDRVADGMSLRKACEEPGSPSRQLVRRRIMEDERIQEAYELACSERREHYVELMVDVALDKEVEPQRGRNLIDALKWRMAREDPKRWGDRKALEVSGPDGPLEIRYGQMSDDDLRAEITRRLAALGLSV